MYPKLTSEEVSNVELGTAVGIRSLFISNSLVHDEINNKLVKTPNKRF
jgi:hypothetical protein